MVSKESTIGPASNHSVNLPVSFQQQGLLSSAKLYFVSADQRPQPLSDPVNFGRPLQRLVALRLNSLLLMTVRHSLPQLGSRGKEGV